MRRKKDFWSKNKDGWIGTVIYLITGFLIALAFNSVLGLALNTDTPVVAVFSNSMVPTFFKGDMIVVMGSEQYAVSDIIVFNSPEKPYPIIHRIYDINGLEIKTKGDNNQQVDPWTIKEENIQGKEILKIPLLGWVKIFFTDLTGFT